MLRREILRLPAAMLLAFPAAAATAAVDIGEGIVGTWILVAVVSQQEDGTRGEPFGTNPRGITMFSRDGNFSLFQSRAGVAPIKPDTWLGGRTVAG